MPLLISAVIDSVKIRSKLIIINLIILSSQVHTLYEYNTHLTFHPHCYKLSQRHNFLFEPQMSSV